MISLDVTSPFDGPVNGLARIGNGVFGGAVGRVGGAIDSRLFEEQAGFFRIRGTGTALADKRT